MYEIRPESLITFVTDSNIKLPRFQRKQTWDDKKNFELCISLFKEYPIGVTILNIDNTQNHTTRWLLDGRQRRNALTQFYNDPENIYNWAKKYIGFLNKDQPDEVEKKFWEKITEYLEDEEIISAEVEQKNSSVNAIEDNSEADPSLEDSENSDIPTQNLYGLNLLIRIIRLTHHKDKISNGFTRPFNFTEYSSNLSYVEYDLGKPKLNSRKVKSFVNEYKNYCRDENLDFSEKDSFELFTLSRAHIPEEKHPQFKVLMNRNWPNIWERIDILERINTLYTNSKIGLIEVKNLEASDSQKIFNIINSKGTTLTAVEILSAKPSWNKVIKDPIEEQLQATQNLYKNIGVKNEGIVKWDLAATVLDRINSTEFFFKKFSDSNSDFEKKLTTGFKLLSGIFNEGIKKDDIDQLGTKNIDWHKDYELLISDLNNMYGNIHKFAYFKFLKSYHFSIMDYLSDAISLNFSILMYKDWKRKSTPNNNQTEKKFQKNAFILLDRLIFEYVTRQWRGSSDGIIARNIGAFNQNPEVFESIPKEKWLELLNEIFNENSILSEKFTNKKILEPLLLHFYALSSIDGPYGNDSLEVDHIYPQSLFSNCSLANKESLQHNLFNLCVLPKKENIAKGKKTLAAIEDSWLKSQITKFTFIEPDEFSEFSNLNNLEKLKEKRSKIILTAYDIKRDDILNN
ncbi:hypothetical protein ADP71_02370 [Vitreoscilla sp. C1]|uniref:DUF262 domain-containing protein n=1 Tax=Vitreoscilla sp. (strain C1) TaxID=96942 RepID=UPI00148EA460|nr:DUF262 domain-containing protein [Vitreoscilla sp. C1]AUZ04057.2 hypothetical protein ADP71_02370 [Vitreoscilla sp. C1]